MPTRNTVALQFQAECKATKPGQAVFVLGSHPELGAWDLQKAILCSTGPTHFPIWTSAPIKLALGSKKVEFKLLIQREDRRGGWESVTWANGENCCLELPARLPVDELLIAYCVWGKPIVQCRRIGQDMAGACALVPKDQTSPPSICAVVPGNQASLPVECIPTPTRSQIFSGTAVTVQFEVKCSATELGQAVFVVGSQPELGAWEPRKAVPCSTTPEDFPIWTSAPIKLACGSSLVQFKLLVQADQRGGGGGSVAWAVGRNCCLELPADLARGGLLIAICAWGEQRVRYRREGQTTCAVVPKNQISLSLEPGMCNNLDDWEAAYSCTKAKLHVQARQTNQTYLPPEPGMRNNRDDCQAAYSHTKAELYVQAHEKNQASLPSEPRPICSEILPRAVVTTEMVTVQFQVECSKRRHMVFVVGSLLELGAWDPKKAIPCKGSKASFIWTCTPVKLPVDAGKVEFKLLLQPEKSRDNVQSMIWAPDGNNCFELPADLAGDEEVTLIASCAWGKQGVQCRRVVQGARAVVTNEEDNKHDFVPELNPTISKSNLQYPSRTSSRYLFLNNDGSFNAEMTRTPSRLMIDVDDFERNAAKKEKEMDELDTNQQREKLNRVQRRMSSSSLLKQMEGITVFADPCETIMLQGFNWESWHAGKGDWYGIVADKVDMFADIGITDIWLPPPSQSVAPQGYLPSQLFNLDGSKYGTLKSLEALLNKMHDKGIRGVADIVINHRCGDRQDSQGRWNVFTSTGIESRPSFSGVMDWQGWAITLGNKFSDGTGENKPSAFDENFDAAPDIDHKNQKVQKSISIWLRWLRLQVGFDAFRFDFVKGYAAEFVGLYCKKSSPAWAVGELWCDMQYDDDGLAHNQNNHRQDLVNWIHATGKMCTAFDFTTKGILQEAVRSCEYWRLKDAEGKPPGLIGWKPKFAVTFIDNHDTGSTQAHWPFPSDKVLIGYAYIITHPGIPSIFWDHVMDWGDDHRRKISDLIKARRESGISVDAPVQIFTAEKDLYVAEIGRPATLRVALGPNAAHDLSCEYWRKAVEGRDFCVWVHKA